MKDDPSSMTVQHNLQALEPDQEISTIPTIVNGVIMEPDVASSDLSLDSIKHHIKIC